MATLIWTLKTDLECVCVFVHWHCSHILAPYEKVLARHRLKGSFLTKPMTHDFSNKVRTFLSGVSVVTGGSGKTVTMVSFFGGLRIDRGEAERQMAPF